MFQASDAICSELKKLGLKVFTEDHGEQSECWLGFDLTNGASYRIRFISKDNDNDVAVRVFGLVRVDDEKRIKLLPVINSLNVKYRYAKFVCDNDGDINVEYDYPVKCTPTESAGEIVARFVNIIKESYPELMRAMWS